MPSGNNVCSTGPQMGVKDLIPFLAKTLSFLQAWTRIQSEMLEAQRERSLSYWGRLGPTELSLPYLKRCLLGPWQGERVPVELPAPFSFCPWGVRNGVEALLVLTEVSGDVSTDKNSRVSRALLGPS